MNHISNLKGKYLFLLISLFITGFSTWAQDSVILSGEIEANSTNIDKIHVINLSLEKGVVTNPKGEFQIFARENDSLYVSSVQFQNTTIIVTEKMIKDQKISIQLYDDVNELAEVVIDDIKLSGNLANDLGKISITEIEEKYKLQNNLNAFIKKDRELNPYIKPVANAGIRLDKIANAVIEKLSREKEKPVNYSSREIANKSIAIVGQQFFREDLDLNENEICNFVYFCTEDTRFKRLVLNNNAFVLIEYFQTRINDFRERRGSILNSPGQIPG